LGDAELYGQLAVVADRPEPRARMELVQAMRNRPGGVGLRVLGRLVTDPVPSVREAAVEVLGEHGQPGAVQALCLVLDREPDRGPEVRVKLAAARALGRLGAPEAVPQLAKLLRTGGLLARFRDPSLRVAAVEALGTIGTTEARQVLEQWRRYPHPRVRAACRRVLAETAAREKNSHAA
jgi:HEAT repeat protein